MPKFYQGQYEVKNPKKYLGSKVPYFRSSWEKTLMEFFDNNSSILGWASESHRIPYVHPITKKITTYVPDFFVVYKNAQGITVAEMLEVKPSSQILENAKKKSDVVQGIINQEKWKMAKQWCDQQGIGFRVVTEKEIYRKSGKNDKKT